MGMAFRQVGIGMLAFACACGGRRGPTDVRLERNGRPSEVGGGATGTAGAASNTSSTSTTTQARVPAKPATGARVRVLAKASARAIAASKTHVYFGDTEDDALYAMPKEGGEPERVARRAPMRGALVADDGDLVWIASPGDTILRLTKDAAEPKIVRDRGIFTDVAANHDVFFTEVSGAGGSLTRVTGFTTAVLATFEGSPRGIAVSSNHVYIATSTALLATTRQRGAIMILARGAAFSYPSLTDDAVVATVATGSRRDVVRVSKNGGPVETVARDVRDAPIATRGNDLFWFAGEALYRNGSVFATDPRLSEPAAIAIDDDGIYVAVGHGDSAVILTIDTR
jgi:hypothetical protein